ncbi:Fanconi anemia group M protein [Periophthalmus magnuspinnatus]|uniref:Fanconi anemia group M protein n=1 Tax=Periophthalmus magnuspinnatus TaxID=409849 RepID=UPI00243643D9|nr:Fanconi anemia group M protein [Periophthalmus magnuspinnatus]
MSNAANQKTLFQAWGTVVSQNKVVPPKNDGKKATARRKTTPSSSSSNTSTYQTIDPRPAPRPALRPSLWSEIGHGSSYSTEGPVSSGEAIATFGYEEDDDDDLMVVAVHEAEKTLQINNTQFRTDDNPRESESSALPFTSPCGQSYPDFPGFDSSSAKVWIYPTNYPLREYQLKISEAALFRNTLVCLPTGLGKTFIASVIMYNFYRWYPSGKIVFMAPTKPLVAQQIEACYKVMGIPQAHMAELTGSTAAKQRQEVWRAKRVFFLTPQVMVNDLSRDTCPAQQVKCVVIDEAHKALGNHAYCQVIRQLASQTKHFRILALSATPGGDTKSVQSVISNLLISHIELRSEESPDIQAHSHQRSVEKMVVPLGETLSAYQTRYLQVLEKFMSRLVQNRVMGHKDLRSLSKYQLILARDQFRKNPPSNIKGPQQGMLEGDFALCISLYHGYELLMQMGLRSLFFYVQGIMDGSREMSRARNELQRTPTFMDLYQEMEVMFIKSPAGPGDQFVYSHPKLEKLEEVVLQHFRQWPTTGVAEPVSTRMMIFSSFRESVQEIASMLNRHAPLIRVMTFMGQASAGKGVKGFTQKEQLEVVQRFRQGGFNTLVSTCVGEEGLDIGEVDLIICFDAQKNPIRLVQRMGRTGRKRQGRIVVILAEGREERTYNQSQSNKRSVHKSITSNHRDFSMYPHSPRMLPDGVNPILHKMHIVCGQFDPRESSRRSKGRRSSAEGRASLIHPHSLMQQVTSISDGFLNSTEYSVWASTMKLNEDEAHPVLKPSHFLSFSTDLDNQEQERTSAAISRELSLSEWRHWQNKSLPTHAVDHSLRCQHFIKIMELIDQMKYEPEGQCHYEDELRPYLCEANSKNAQKKSKPCAKNKKTNHSSLYDPDFIYDERETNIPQEEQRFPVESTAVTETTSSQSVNDNCMEILEDASTSNANKEHVKPSLTDHNSDHIPLKFDEEADLEFQAMFYLPNWGTRLSSFKPMGKDRDDHLKVILANVSELLSRSPPSLDFEDADILSSEIVSPKEPTCQPFQVTFNLDDEDEEGEMEISDNANYMEDSRAKIQSEKGSTIHSSPTWEEVFEDDVFEENANIERREEVIKLTEVKNFKPDVNESIDLFEDDEAFLEMSIPDIPTPKDSSIHQKEQENCEIIKSETLGNVDNTTKIMMLEDTHVAENSLSIKNINDLIAIEELECKTTNLQPKSFENSNDLFSVNFDLGFSVDDSEEEEITEANSSKCLPPSPQPQNPRLSLQASSNFSTPYTGFAKQHRPSVRPQEATLSSPRLAHMNKSDLFSSPLGARGSALPSPISTLHASAPRLKLNQSKGAESMRELVKNSSDSEEEVVIQNRKQPKKLHYFSSPEKTRNVSDVDSPVVLKRKRAAALDTSSEMEKGTISDDDFQNDSVFTKINPGPEPKRKFPKQGKDQHSSRRRAHHFLDDEAELSEDEEVVSSDEEDGEEQNRSLDGFVVDNSHLSQGLDESEMHGVYLKSVRSPAVLGKFKMSYKSRNNMDIFSQVPEMDETYAEDSFVVGSDEEEQSEDCSEEEEELGPLLPEESYVHGKRQYATRRRVFLHQARANRGGTKAKCTRVIRVQDSSDEETEGNDKNAVVTHERSSSSHENRLEHHNGQSSSTIASKVSRLSRAPNVLPTNEQRDERCRKRIETEHLLSDELDFVESDSLLAANTSAQSIPSASARAPPHTTTVGPVRLLVDSRCLTGAVELVTCLRQRHSATVHVCSLDSSYIIVSARMAVERQGQSDVASAQNRKRLVERVKSLQTLFERVCLIVEKDRIKPGDTARPFQRTRYYDSTLAALVRSGLRLLWSNGPEDSAALLVELARLEQRKSHGISVPLDVAGALRQQALQMYLNLPSVNYVHALSLCHNFRTISQLVNSSIEAVQKGGCMSRSRAEEVYTFLRYSCDSFLMNTSR